MGPLHQAVAVELHWRDAIIRSSAFLRRMAKLIVPPRVACREKQHISEWVHVLVAFRHAVLRVLVWPNHDVSVAAVEPLRGRQVIPFLRFVIPLKAFANK